MPVHAEICPFMSPLSSGSLNVSAIHHHETGIIGWVINHCLLWELWSVYLNAQESHLIVDIFVHMLTAHDSPVIPAAPCLRLPKPYIIAFTLSQETFNASLSEQQYKSGSFIFHLRKKKIKSDAFCYWVKFKLLSSVKVDLGGTFGCAGQQPRWCEDLFWTLYGLKFFSRCIFSALTCDFCVNRNGCSGVAVTGSLGPL